MTDTYTAVARVLKTPIRIAHAGVTAPGSVANAFRCVADDIRGREERERLAPGRRPDGPGNWLAAIGTDECWRLLATQRLGRIGFTAHSGHQVILPVNYVVHEGTIMIRSGRGPKLEAARRGALVAFEVDAIDLDAHTGWSVTIGGHARWVRDPRELTSLTAVDFPAWAGGPRNEIVVIEPAHVAGRRLSASGVVEAEE